MRIRTRLDGGVNGSINACTNFSSGETEDYLINIISRPCGGSPVMGNVQSSSSVPVCAYTNFNLTLLMDSVRSGLSFIWQKSTDLLSWNNIASATSYYFTTTQSVSTYYRCITSCSILNADTSAAYFMQSKPIIFCPCNSTSTSDADDDIGNVTFGQLNNGVAGVVLNNPSSFHTYSDFTTLQPDTFKASVLRSVCLTRFRAE